MGRPRQGFPCGWGQIEARPSKSGAMRYRLRGRVEGRMATVGTYDTVEEAQEVADAMREESKARTTGLTLDAWVPQHIDRRERGGRHRDHAHPKVLYRHVVGTRLGGMLLRKIRPEDVRRWISEVAAKRVASGKRKGEPLQRSTVKKAMSALSACLEDAASAGVRGGVIANPCVGIPAPAEAPRTTEEWHYLTVEEIACVREGKSWLPRMHWTAFTLAIYTGLRQGELWGLQWTDVRGLKSARPHLLVRHSFDGATKGGRVRQVPLFPPALAALTSWRRHGGTVALGGLVFPSTYSGREGQCFAVNYDARWADSYGRQDRRGKRPRIPGYRAQLGIRPEVRFHDLRHTFGAHLVSGTWGRAWRLEEVQRVMGHRSRKTTEIYAHLAPEGMARAVLEAVDQWSESGS